MPIYFVIASMVWVLVLLNYLFIILNQSRHCLVCRPLEAVPAFPFPRVRFPFPRVWFSFGAVPRENAGGWWFWASSLSQSGL